MTSVAAIIRGSWRLERETTAVEWLVRRRAATALASSLLNWVRTYMWYDLTEYNDLQKYGLWCRSKKMEMRYEREVVV